MKIDLQPVIRTLICDFPGIPNHELQRMILIGHPEFARLSQTWLRVQICSLRSQLRQRKRIDLPGTSG